MFKKIISALVASAIVMTLSVPAFAASETIKSGNGSVTLSEVTSKETKTIKIDGKSETVTIYYCPVGTKVTVKADPNAGIFGTSFYAQDGDGYVGVGGGYDTDCVVGQQGKGLEAYFAINTGTHVYVMQSSEAKAPVTSNTQQGNGGSGISEPAPGVNNADTTQAPVKPSAPIRSGLDIIHTVKMGDTFGGLALNYFGDMTCWPAIYNYNANAINATKDKQIFEGMELIIPSAVKHGEKNISAITPCVLGNGEKLYTVQSGDTLGTIALAQYKDMSKYKAIFERNADRLASANTIYAGQIIVMPVQ